MAAVIYATEADIVENLSGVSFRAGKPVTDIALNNILAQESQVIDQHIQQRYELEITDVDALIFLKKICIDLVIYRVTKIIRPRTIEPVPGAKTNTQEISHSSAFRVSMKMLVDIQDGVKTLPNIDLKARTFVSSTLQSDNVQQTFEKDKIQW